MCVKWDPDLSRFEVCDETHEIYDSSLCYDMKKLTWLLDNNDRLDARVLNHSISSGNTKKIINLSSSVE